MPGDIYPDSSFSTKLLSKRIAHKLSEKSRRNRLAAAIREIQKLLPSKAQGEAAHNDNNNNNEISDDKEPSPQFQCMGPTSKVEIVELAVGYIRKLKQEKDEATRRAREAEQQLYSTRKGPSSPVNNESNLHKE
ncbi:putative phosphorus acquisition-controlling protein [Diplogelasinospora grovesii]|uniref:Phosphorus acquisition-controlling protein n=1 Tax=Diplogelasinospora grovesii TaxID=303347 RepID=A0AAN6MWB1_9PEZI|nr:putative phosphorus acquisition-controlling protein [Diplogelasinospora grovesii]